MPFSWFMFSVASSPFVARYRDDPERLDAEVRRVLEDAGAQLVEGLFFDAARERAYALVKDVEVDAEGRADFPKLKALTGLLGARYQKLLTVDEEIEARRTRAPWSGEGGETAELA